MAYIVLDLEWNGAYSSKAHGYFNEIIEIGAVKASEDGGTPRILDTFHAVIKPVVSVKLSEIVMNLTSITSEDLEEGTTFAGAMEGLRAFIGEERSVVLTWSTTDLLVLIENFRFFTGSERIPFMDAYVDLQAYCQRRMGADMSQQMGLSRACEELHIDEEGMDFHRALDDSLLTARILQKVYEPVSLQEAAATADEEFYRRATFKTTIIASLDSPLISRSELRFACPDCQRNLKRTGEWKFRNRAHFADFRCGVCGREFTGRVQAKLKYEGVELKKKLLERKAKAQEADAGQEGTAVPEEAAPQA